MGNKMSLELKEGRPCLEIGESLVRDFQDRIFSTDKAMSGFVKAIDSMEAACEELDRKLRPRVDVTKEEKDKDCDLNDEQRAAKLLWTIKECVSDHKFVVLECLSKFMKLIIETGKGYIDYPSDLSIDKYRQSNKVEDKPYYDTRIEMIGELDKEVDNLVLMNKDMDSTLRYVQLKFENQNIALDVLKRREKMAHQDYEEMKQNAEEYKAKTDKCLDEILIYIKGMTSDIENKEKKKNASKERDACQQHEPGSSERNIGNNEAYDSNMENNKTDNRVGEIKDCLKHLKEKLEKCDTLNNQDNQEEWQMVSKTEDYKEKEDEIEKYVSKISILMKENVQLKQELDCLKEKQVMHVQVYFRHGLKGGSKEEQKLLMMLKKSMSLMSAELVVEELWAPSKVHPGIPLLIFRSILYNYSEWGKGGSSNLLDKFDLSRKMALVTFHFKEKNILIISNGELEEPLRKLGGLFDFGYRKNSAEFVFDECEINGIIEFIINNNCRKNQDKDKHFLGR
ncbi:putative leucine-rich repeat-containing protein DDB_G0290503 [Ruditapes philippinarum]|uniref:putative leucine-rich repeat-containing protein DDB_G0290503 n=1 Tax=Ruditapes philippinarum TaxID=129788 RepID=UPI00295AC0A4|nr:putative leucine-rich repeat-containing protein DDB_G0290503 [Ruditapes philippinarum]